MADKAKAQILPWVDNVLSRMIFFFHYSSWVRPPAHSRAHQSGVRIRPPRAPEPTSPPHPNVGLAFLPT